MNSKGFIFLPILLMTALFILTAAYGLSGYEAALTLERFETLHTSKRNLEMTFNFMYAKDTDCTALFLPAASNRLGPLITTAMQNSQAQASGSLSLSFSGKSTPFAGPDISFEGLKIKDVRFTKIKRPDPSVNSFLIDLSVSFSPGVTSGPSFAPLTLPFYVIADASGNPTQCFLSRYTSSGLTIEDQLCETKSGIGYQYEPAEGKCVL